MVRRVFVAFALGTTILFACAAEQVGRTTTTSGILERPSCAQFEGSCERDDDCCSMWCVAEQCERHDP
jgi:hypothetical protein